MPKQHPDRQTQAEIPQYVAQHSITAQIVKAAALVHTGMATFAATCDSTRTGSSATRAT